MKEKRQYEISQELEVLVRETKRFMMRYNPPRNTPFPRRIQKGGTAQNPKVLQNPDIIKDGYSWGKSSVGLYLREADGFHGGDYIGIFEQTQDVLEPEIGPEHIGVVSYEGGNGSLYGYATFDMNDSQRVALSYNFQNDSYQKEIFTLEDFVKRVHDSRGKTHHVSVNGTKPIFRKKTLYRG